ncbi:aspartate aminotransferase family protein [Chelatococcus sp. SYSU_G07232]|uniref:Aspartate aminotransferase family protein n=1 Tax=Chelatococcus albus TaxID=3047466 RepID=A0ABT7AL02_9HYPH|nr:aspartate aminotransferase family protein [Chelatococcus sp. SYSU_G07232]MDJ1160056.1 aspartate aminotransferase family protein [Chelatococcus sp. SYSU_G07232]
MASPSRKDTGLDVAQSESDTNLTSRRAAWQATNLDAAARRILAEDERHFLRQSVSTPCLNVVAKAEGIFIEDTAGRRYMDFHGNNVHHVGYGHPRLKRAIAEQMDALPFAPRRYACEPAAALARKLAAIAPGDLGKVLFTTGGSDAIEVAVKIARTATGRFKTLSFWDAFHGAGFGAGALSGEALFRSGPAAPLVAGAAHVAPFACYRCPYGYATDADGNPPLELCKVACARMVDYVLSREGDVAAVIAEPARAVPYVPPPGFWQIVREACDRHGALLVFDEIPTGLGKTGRMFACEHDGVVPDILVMGKGLGGGILPIAAVVARPDLDVGGHYAFGHYTHEKNPVTARAALTTIEIIEEEGLIANAAHVGALALARLKEMKRRLPAIGDVRGRGLLLGIELVADRETREPANDLAEAVMYRALDHGLSFKTTMGNVLTLTPPLVVTEAQMLEALAIIEEAIAAG